MSAFIQITRSSKSPSLVDQQDGVPGTSNCTVQYTSLLSQHVLNVRVTHDFEIIDAAGTYGNGNNKVHRGVSIKKAMIRSSSYISSISKATVLFKKKDIISLPHRCGVSSRTTHTSCHNFHSSSHIPKPKRCEKEYFNLSTLTSNCAALLEAVAAVGVGSFAVIKKIEDKLKEMNNSSFLQSMMNGMTSQCEEKKTEISHIPSSNSFKSNIFNNSDHNAMLYYYEKVTDANGWNQSHAVFGALMKKGLIERCDMYKTVPIEKNDKQLDSLSIENNNINKRNNDAPKNQEILLADIRIGKDLNGHDGIVHGGIISLLFDESFGWSFEAMPTNNVGHGANDDDENSIVVTANLNVNYRKPLPAETNVVIRVYHEETKGRKVYLSARMENFDGSIVYSDATVLFIKLKKSLLIQAH